MKINWFVNGEKEWAFGSVIKPLIENMPEYDHLIDEKDADIHCVLSPNHIRRGAVTGAKTIMHVDSNRWYEVFL